MKNFLNGLLPPIGFSFVLVLALFIPHIWPPEYSLLFDSLFLSSTLLMLTNFVIILYLYLHGGSTQTAHFVFALMLIISASLMYSGFEQISARTTMWSPLLSTKHPTLFTLLPQLISYAKNIISFGFAALGASLAANVITDRFAKRQRELGNKRQPSQ